MCTYLVRPVLETRLHQHPVVNKCHNNLTSSKHRHLDQTMRLHRLNCSVDGYFNVFQPSCEVYINREHVRIANR